MPRALVPMFALSSAVLILAACDDPTRPDPDALLSRASLSDGPSYISAGPLSATGISIGWDDNSRNESGFELHRSTTGVAGTYSQLVRVGPDVTNYTDEGLSQGAEYCYMVRSFKANGKNTAFSAFTTPTCARTLNPPPAPTGVSAVPSPNGVIDVAWVQATSTVNGFRVERSELPEGPWVSATFHIAASPYRDLGRPTETQACYRVFAFNNDGNSPPSAVDCTTPPAPPADLVATSGGPESIDLAWTDKSASEDGFEIQRSVDHSIWNTIATPSANATAYHDAGLTTNTRYFYRVRARKDGGFSAFAPAASALVVGSAPPAPTDASAYGWASTATGVSWTSVAVNVEGFRVERSTNNQASWEIAGSVPSNHQGFSEVGRTPEQQVCYRVFAVNRVGDSPASNVDCVTPPAAVQDLAAVPAGNGSIDLTWSNPSSVTSGFVLEYFQYFPGGWSGGGYGCYYGCYYQYPYEAWTPIMTLPADARSHTVEGFTADRLHQFRILTLAPDAVADPSPVAASLTEFTPAAPTSLTATAVAGGVELRWTDNSSNEAQFNVYRCVGAVASCPSDSSLLAQVAANATTYTDGWAQPGSTYTYKVVAANGLAESASTNLATVTVPTSLDK